MKNYQGKKKKRYPPLLNFFRCGIHWSLKGYPVRTMPSIRPQQSRSSFQMVLQTNTTFKAERLPRVRFLDPQSEMEN